MLLWNLLFNQLCRMKSSRQNTCSGAILETEWNILDYIKHNVPKEEEDIQKAKGMLHSQSDPKIERGRVDSLSK